MGKKSPCYGCQRRWATTKDSCHSSCKEYKEFSEERNEELTLQRKKREEDAMVTAVLINSIKKSTKDTTANKQNAWKG